MTFLDWLLVATGPAFLLWRRVFYTACWAAGNVIAARDGREVNEAQAFAIGKQKVLQTAADLVIVRLSKIDWPGIGEGLLVLREKLDAAAHIVWRGIVRDVRILCTFPILIRRWLRERRLEAVQAMRMVAAWQDKLGLDDGASGQLVKANIEGLELRKAVLARELSEGVAPHLMREKVSELTHIRSFLGAHYAEQAPPPQVQALLSPVLIPAKLKVMALAGLAFAVLTLGLYVQTKRVWALKAGAAESERRIIELADNRDGWMEAYQREHAKAVEAVALSKTTAKTFEAERAQARVAAAKERRRQRDIQNILNGSGDPPDWAAAIGLLPREVGENGDSAPAPDSGGPAAATSGMPRDPG